MKQTENNDSIKEVRASLYYIQGFIQNFLPGGESVYRIVLDNYKRGCDNIQ